MTTLSFDTKKKLIELSKQKPSDRRYGDEQAIITAIIAETGLTDREILKTKFILGNLIIWVHMPDDYYQLKIKKALIVV